MSRSRLTAVISEFSSTILNPFDLQQLLHRLTSHAMALTGSQGAGIVLAGRGEGKLGFAAASDERAIEMELIQDRLEDGPCYQAFLDNHPMAVQDLASSHQWPAYEHRAAQSGVRAVLSVPMHAWGETIGVLSIYRDEPGPWSVEDVEAAQIITSLGAGYVLHANQIRAQHELTDQLQETLEGRDLIGQAKGILMNRDALDADTAFEQLRSMSQSQNIEMREVAARLVEAGEARSVATGSSPAAATPRSRTAPSAAAHASIDADARTASEGVSAGHGKLRSQQTVAQAMDDQAVSRGRDELRRAPEDAADRAQVGQAFVAMVVHDIRTPVQVIAGLAEVLQQRIAELDPSRVQEFLATVARNTERIERLIDDILAVSQLESEGFRYDLAPVDLRQVADEVATAIHQSAGRAVEVSADPDLPPALADVDRQQQVLSNLLSNAAKFSPDGAPIGLRIEHHDGHLVVHVGDQGRGIDSHELDELFEPFTRLEHRASDQVRGTGLGLYISKMLVEGQGGTIDVDSEVGRGTTITYTIPIAADRAPSANWRETARRSTGGEAPR